MSCPWHTLTMKKHWTGAHTKHRLRLHLVFIPKYRKRVLKNKIAETIRHLFYESCKMNDWWIHEMEIMPDHIHILIQINPRESVAKIVQRLKGASSKIVRDKYPELEEFLWGDSFWSDGYFAESVGSIDEEVIKRYIREQRDD